LISAEATTYGTQVAPEWSHSETGLLASTEPALASGVTLP
jgi:hypothetical protein